MNRLSANDRIVEDLNRYTRIKAPGYAFLVDAPWGAGKTTFIRKWMKSRKDVIYVSMFGIKDRSHFEASILEAILERNPRLKPTKTAKAFDDIASHWIGLKTGFTDLHRRSALRCAPRIIIVDDLERSLLSANEALSLINDYLEHQKKNVIIISNQEELIKNWSDGTQTYADLKEKIIGRVSRFNPESSIVLDDYVKPVFLKDLTRRALRFVGFRATNSYTYFLQNEKDQVQKIFDRSKSSNLRVLKQSLRDFENIFLILLEHGQIDVEKARYALSTYLALSIAFHRGKGFGLEDLRQGGNLERLVWMGNGKNGDEPAKMPIDLLSDQYAGIKEVALNGLVISGDLAVATIGLGDFTKEQIRTELGMSPILSSSSQESWRILWHWFNQEADEAQKALSEVLQNVNKHTYNDPVVVLHVFCILADLERAGVNLDLRGSVWDSFQNYISKLDHIANTDLLSAKHPYSENLFDRNRTGLAFLGSRTSDFPTKAAAALEARMDQIFWDDLKNNPKKILDAVRQDIKSALLSLDNRGRPEGVPNYSHIPVLAFTPIDEMADAILSTDLGSGLSFIKILRERVERFNAIKDEDLRANWPDETVWAKAFAEALVKKASSQNGDIRAAQRNVLIKIAKDSFI